MYILINKKGQYLSEYLLGEIIFSNSMHHAMTFDDDFIAIEFKNRIKKEQNIDLIVQTFIK